MGNFMGGWMKLPDNARNFPTCVGNLHGIYGEWKKLLIGSRPAILFVSANTATSRRPNISALWGGDLGFLLPRTLAKNRRWPGVDLASNRSNVPQYRKGGLSMNSTSQKSPSTQIPPGGLRSGSRFSMLVGATDGRRNSGKLGCKTHIPRHSGK